MTDIADRYRTLAARFADRIAEVPDGAWDDPTPCAEWTVRDLVGHVVDVQGMFLAFVGEEIGELPDVSVDAVGAWAAASAAMQAALDDPARADAGFDGYFGPTTLAASVDRFVSFDLVVHGWDLARAVGGDERIDPAEVARLLGEIPAFGPALQSSGAAGPPVEVADDADDQTRMLALLGRRA